MRTMVDCSASIDEGEGATTMGIGIDERTDLTLTRGWCGMASRGTLRNRQRQAEGDS